MAIINGTSEDIGDAYAPSINAAKAQLEAESNRVVQILSPYGGRRTVAEQIFINPSISPLQSDHVKGRAVDIDNQAQLRGRLGSARFVAILKAWGWFNIQVNGAPFPTEPWHFANHSSTPAGSGGTAIPSTPDHTQLMQQEEGNMLVASSTTGPVWEVFFDVDLGASRRRLVPFNETSWMRDLPPSLVRVSSQGSFDALLAVTPIAVPKAPLDPAAVKATITAAVNEALADVELPTPDLSDADAKQFADAVAAKFGAALLQPPG